MAADTDAEDEAEEFESEYATERQTAPQGPYTTRDVAVGFIIAAVGLVVTFGIPLLLG
jgi:hypothetical protein